MAQVSRELLDADGALLFTDESDDRFDLFASDALDGRHVAEVPVVGADASLGGEQEGAVAVVAGDVEGVEEGRPFVCAIEVGTVASGAGLCEEGGAIGAFEGDDGGGVAIGVAAGGEQGDGGEGEEGRGVGSRGLQVGVFVVLSG